MWSLGIPVTDWWPKWKPRSTYTVRVVPSAWAPIATWVDKDWAGLGCPVITLTVHSGLILHLLPRDRHGAHLPPHYLPNTPPLLHQPFQLQPLSPSAPVPSLCSLLFLDQITGETRPNTPASCKKLLSSRESVKCFPTKLVSNHTKLIRILKTESKTCSDLLLLIPQKSNPSIRKISETGANLWLKSQGYSENQSHPHWIETRPQYRFISTSDYKD